MNEVNDRKGLWIRFHPLGGMTRMDLMRIFAPKY